MKRTALCLLAGLVGSAPSAGFAEGGPARPAQRAAPELRTATTHPMQYWLSLPAGHTPRQRWPVLVVVPDAGRDFAGNLATFAAAAADEPLILVAPIVLTSGGRRRGEPFPYDDAAWKTADRAGDFGFDRDGLAAVLADVRRLDGGEERVAITGWEAGGHTVWALLFQRPEWFRAVIPVSTNYLGRWMTEGDFSHDPSRAGLPVTVLFCDRQAGDLEAARQHLLAQTRDALAVASAHGFGNLTERILDGRAHGPLAADVLATLAER